jgi:hypothetical protein
MMKISRSYQFHDEFYPLNLLSIPLDNIYCRSFGSFYLIVWITVVQLVVFQSFKKDRMYHDLS